MKHITTPSGFSCEIDEAKLNDMELFDALVELDAGNMTALPTVVGKIIGGEKKRLYNHVRASDGTVPIEQVAAEVRHIIQALGEKNS